MEKSKKTEKKNKKSKLGIGARFSIYYWSFFSVLSILALIFNDELSSFFNNNLKLFVADKIAVLAVAVAINICITTSLTLSISIQTGDKHKIGLSPKELNEYLDKPISLCSSFVLLIFTSMAMVAFIKLNCSTAFFLIIIASLIYFLISIITAIPVLSVDMSLWFKKLYPLLSDEENVENSSTIYRTLNYFFERKTSMLELFNNIVGAGKENLDKVQINLINFLYKYIEECSDVPVIAFYAKEVSEFIYDIPSKESRLSFLNNEDDAYRLLYILSSKKSGHNTIFEALFYSIFKYADIYKNKENYLSIRNIYLRFVANAFQTNKLDIIAKTKNFICSYNFCDLYNKQSVTVFLVISFLMYSYCIDSKVPKEYKNNIVTLKENDDNGSRYPRRSWSNLFCSLLESEKEIDKNEFISIIKKFEIYFEYSIYGEVYTPIITVGNALYWIWSLMLSSDSGFNLDSLIDRENESEIFSFDRYIDYDSKNYLKSFQFFGKNVDEQIIDKKLIDEFKILLNQTNKKRQDKELKTNSLGKKEINDLIKASLKTELNPLRNYKKADENRTFTTETFPMEFFYENSIESKLNANVISYNVNSIIKNTLLSRLNVSKIKKEELENRFINNSAELKSVNRIFMNYVKYGYFKEYENFILNLATANCPLVNVYPTCFIGPIPLIKNIKINVTNGCISEKNLSDLKEQFRTNNGGYLVRSATYNESEFIKFAKENFVAVKITIEVAYSFEKTEVLEVDPF